MLQRQRGPRLGDRFPPAGYTATTGEYTERETTLVVRRSESVSRVEYVYVIMDVETERCEAGASQAQKAIETETAANSARRRLDLDNEELPPPPPKPDIISVDELEDLPDDSIVDTPRGVATVTRTRSDRDKKLGHRRVRTDGHTTYKKVQTSQIMGSIQLGIQHAVGGLASKPERDVLMQDFMTEETYNFPAMGSNHTPAHHYSEFRFKNYAPIAFR